MNMTMITMTAIICITLVVICIFGNKKDGDEK
jgi:Sec-independent protein translocase protein TatA